jgi:hypothetical protein
MPRSSAVAAWLTLLAAPLAGQQSAPSTPAAPPAAGAAAPVSHTVPTAEQQIAAAVLPLPEAMRADARVLGYAPDGRLVVLRPGPDTGTMTCLISRPGAPRFQLACYHNSMEGYMARGRELRAQGMNNPEARDSVRKADVLAGRIHLPSSAAMYELNGPADAWDPATNTLHGVTPLYVLYMPFATPQTSGVSATPSRAQPWLMHPGEPGAHVMYVPPTP